MSIFGCRGRFLMKFSTLLGFSQSENQLRTFSSHEKIFLTLIQGIQIFEPFQGYKKPRSFEVWILTRKHEFRSKRPIGSYSAYTLTHYRKKISSKTSEKCRFQMYFLSGNNLFYNPIFTRCGKKTGTLPIFEVIFSQI